MKFIRLTQIFILKNIFAIYAALYRVGGTVSPLEGKIPLRSQENFFAKGQYFPTAEIEKFLMKYVSSGEIINYLLTVAPAGRRGQYPPESKKCGQRMLFSMAV